MQCVCVCVCVCGVIPEARMRREQGKETQGDIRSSTLQDLWAIDNLCSLQLGALLGQACGPLLVIVTSYPLQTCYDGGWQHLMSFHLQGQGPPHAGKFQRGIRS